MTTTTTPAFPSTWSKRHTEDRGDFELDTRWTAIDAYTLSHLHPESRPSHSPLAFAAENAAKQGIDDIALPPSMGKFLALQCRMLKVKHVLEVGTLAGYSALWMLLENPDLKITTLEFDPRHVIISRENFEHADVSDRVEIIDGPALNALPKLHEEVVSGKREKFDFAFIDADKLNNWDYLDWAVKMMSSGGCIVVDNVVAKGSLADANAMDHDAVAGGRKVVEEVGKDDRLDAVVMQTVSEKDYDGFLIACVK